MKINEQYLESIIRGKKVPTTIPESAKAVTELAQPTQGSTTTPDSKKTTPILDDLYSKAGLEHTRTWFLEHVKNRSQTFTENQFVSFLRKLTDFSDWEIFEIFDIVDPNRTGGVGWDQFLLVISLYASHACRKTTKFLYKHASSIYNLLLDRTFGNLTFERFARFGFMVGVSEDDILYTLQYFEIKKSDVHKITLEDFTLYYFAILHKLDGGIDLTDHLRADFAPPVSNQNASGSAPGSGATQQKCIIS